MLDCTSRVNVLGGTVWRRVTVTFPRAGFGIISKRATINFSRQVPCQRAGPSGDETLKYRCQRGSHFTITYQRAVLGFFLETCESQPPVCRSFLRAGQGGEVARIHVSTRGPFHSQVSSCRFGPLCSKVPVSHTYRQVTSQRAGQSGEVIQKVQVST